MAKETCCPHAAFAIPPPPAHCPRREARAEAKRRGLANVTFLNPGLDEEQLPGEPRFQASRGGSSLGRQLSGCSCAQEITAGRLAP